MEDCGWRTRLFLSGPGCVEVAALFAGSLLQTVPLPGKQLCAASAVKVAYASWTKGSSALLLAVHSFAQAHGVHDALMEEWGRSQKPLLARSRFLGRVAPKAWRFVGEMEEISAAYEASGLPGGFHGASASVYRRLAHLKGTLAEAATAEGMAVMLREDGAAEEGPSQVEAKAVEHGNAER